MLKTKKGKSEVLSRGFSLRDSEAEQRELQLFAYSLLKF